MNELLITNSLEGTPLTISATSMLSLDGMGTGAIRSSVFEINNSSSNVNFISHVWSCCSDLFFAEKACGPQGRQFDSSESIPLDRSTNSLSSGTNLMVLETKQVSAIDADHKNEVRLKSVPFFNTEDQNPWG
jgi:Ulp1 family protease